MAARMRAETQLDYAIFQLTPTRTRCELHVAAQGSTYKLASGLVKPFVSHLKTAEEQLAKGGYSIRLEPPDPDRATWFTKGTMERFVRFVSTPELLERVSTVETELAELEETARQQLAEANNDSNSSPQTDSPAPKSLAIIPAGGKPSPLASADKPPAKAAAPAADEATAVDEVSTKQRLLRALDARRAMLQKEQGMAFARAFAAGFNLENIDDLVLFSECFGASRLRDACMKFVALCKKRQEAGLEIEEIHEVEMFYPSIPSMGGVPNWVEPPPQVEILTAAASSTNGGAVNGVNEGETEAAGGRGETALPSKLAQGHPVMTPPWQRQSQQNQYLLHHAAYGPMHYGLAAGPYPHQYMTSPFMPPPPYADAAAVWPMHPQYWAAAANQVRDQEGNAASPPNKDRRERAAAKFHDEIMEASLSADEAPDSYDKGSSRRRRRRSASPTRRSFGDAKPRSRMVVIRNINYIAPKAEKMDDVDDEDFDEGASSGSNWSEGGAHHEYEEGNNGTFELNADTLRSSINQAMGIAGNLKQRGNDSRNNRHKSSKKGRSLKVPAAGSSRKGQQPPTPDANVYGGDSEGNESDSKMDVASSNHMSNYTPSGNDIERSNIGERKMVQQDSCFLGSLNKAREGSSDSFFTLQQTSELDYGTNRTTVGGDSVKGELGSNGYWREDMVAVSSAGKATGNLPVDMMLAEQKTQQKHLGVVDDSFMMIPDAAPRSNTAVVATSAIDAAHDLSFKAAEEKVADYSIALLDRCAASDGGNRGAWKMPLNLEMEMPAAEMRQSTVQNVDISVRTTAAPEPDMFEPEDLFMAADRPTHNRAAWDSYDMYYDMQTLEAERVDESHEEGEGDDAAAQENGTVAHEDGGGEGEEAGSTGKEAKGGAGGKGRAMVEKRRSSMTGGRVGGRAHHPHPALAAEAQLRAEKLRAYKAGLQRSKKEKEEEERKRIEDLKNQRRERITARTMSSSAAAALHTTPNRTKLTPSPSSPPPKMPKPISSSAASPRDKMSSAARLARLSSPKSLDNQVARSVPSLAELHKQDSRKSAPPFELHKQDSRKSAPPSELHKQDSRKSAPPSELHKQDSRKSAPPSELHEHDSRKPVPSLPASALQKESLHKIPPSPPPPVSSARGSASTELSKSHVLLKKPPPPPGPVSDANSNGHAQKSKAMLHPSKPVRIDANPNANKLENGRGVEDKNSGPVVEQKVVKAGTGSAPEAVKTGKQFIGTDSPVKPQPTVTTVAETTTLSPKELEKAAPFASASLTERTSDVVKLAAKEQNTRETATVHVSSQQKNGGDTPAHENGISSCSAPSPSSVVAVEPSMIHVQEEGSCITDDIAVSKEAAFVEDVAVAVEEDGNNDGGVISETEMSSLASENGCTNDGNNEQLRSSRAAESNATTPPPEHSVLSNYSLEGTASSPDPHQVPSSSSSSSGSKSRKKWGDTTKAKGLKKLLLLGRKSSKSSPDRMMIHSEEEEEEQRASNNKTSPVVDDATKSEGGGSLVSSSSSTKGSRSFFSLSLRGKGSSSSTVKA